MVVNLKAQLKEELRESREERTIRISLTLPSQTTIALEQLHQELGGDEVVTKPELAARLLTRMLVAKHDTSGSRKNKRGKAVLDSVAASPEE